MKVGNRWVGSVPPLERLMQRVVEAPGPLDTPCWIPTYKTNRRGYVMVHKGLRGTGTSPAHRITYEAMIGPVPDGLELDHLCRVHACCNPAHVEPVTHRENVMRGNAPMIVAHRTNICLKGHSLVDAYRMKNGRRRCRVCTLDYQRRQRMQVPA